MPEAIRIRYDQRPAPVAGVILEITAALKGTASGWVGADGGGRDG